MKSVHIRSYFGSHFPTFGLNTDQNNSEYGHFSRTDSMTALTYETLAQLWLWQHLLETVSVCYIKWCQHSDYSLESDHCSSTEPISVIRFLVRYIFRFRIKTSFLKWKLRFQIAIPIYIRSFVSTLLLQRKFKVSFPESTLETTFRI